MNNINKFVKEHLPLTVLFVLILFGFSVYILGPLFFIPWLLFFGYLWESNRSSQTSTYSEIKKQEGSLAKNPFFFIVKIILICMFSFFFIYLYSAAILQYSKSTFETIIGFSFLILLLLAFITNKLVENKKIKSFIFVFFFFIYLVIFVGSFYI